MIRETGRGYDPEEEMKKKRGKKSEVKAEMVEFLVETTSLTTSVSGLGVDKLAGNASGLIDGMEKLHSLDVTKFESIRRMGEYAEVYEETLIKADEFAKKDEEETKEKIIGIRKKIKDISNKDKKKQCKK